MKKYRPFYVNVVNNGFVVDIGCQHLVFTDLHVLADVLHEYADDPDGIEKRYMSESIIQGEVRLENQVPTSQAEGPATEPSGRTIRPPGGLR